MPRILRTIIGSIGIHFITSCVPAQRTNESSPAFSIVLSVFAILIILWMLIYWGLQSLKDRKFFRTPSLWATLSVILLVLLISLFPRQLLPFPLRITLYEADRLVPNLESAGFSLDDTKKLIDLLSCRCPESNTAVNILIQQGKGVVPFIKESLHHPESEVRGKAILALSGIGPEARQILPDVLGVLENEKNSFVQMMGLSYILNLGKISDEPPSIAVKYLQVRGGTAAAAADLIATHGAGATNVLPQLRSALTTAQQNNHAYSYDRISLAIHSICHDITNKGGDVRSYPECGIVRPDK